MFSRRNRIALLLPALFFCAMPAAHAQWAVIDVGAIAQLIQQVQLAEQELATAQNTFAQAQQQYNAITGDRGMEFLLGGINRNYLPTSLAQINAVLAGRGGAFAGLGAQINGLIAGNAILTPAQLAVLSPTEQASVSSARQNAALLQALSGQALSTTSARFANLQSLIAAIPSAHDEKGSLDLQARIAAEQAMLANDESKLQALYRTAQAQEWARDQQAREQAIADIGSFRNLPRMGL